jgi:indole-3-glycerol phosphate synthase
VIHASGPDILRAPVSAVCGVSFLPRGIVAKRSLFDILATARERRFPAVLIDIKKRSPRDGELLADRRIEPYVRSLAEAGVEAMSVPTDPVHFGGGLELARRVRSVCPVPLMRKEFFRSVGQIDESKLVGFDAVQLSLGTIPDPKLFDALRTRAERLGLEVVVGVHGRDQLRRALALGARLIGLNNRDIGALELDGGTVGATESLLPSVPEDVLVISESGLRTSADVHRAARAGADGVLIGTAAAASADPPAWVRSLRAHAPSCPA